MAQGYSPSNPSGSVSERIESHGHVREGRDSTDALIDRAAAAGYQDTVDPHRAAALLRANPLYPDQMGWIHGTVHLCIPEHIAIQLQLRELEQREVILADRHQPTPARRRNGMGWRSKECMEACPLEWGAG